MTPFVRALSTVLSFVAAHWFRLLLVSLAVYVLVLIYRALVTRLGPGDLTGNGLSVGPPKNFDNRSLTLMLEQLNATLQGLNVVDGSVTKSLGTFQQQDVESSSNRVSFGSKPAPASSSDKKTAGGKEKSDPGEKAENRYDDPAKTSNPAAPSPTFGIGAPDALTNQLDLTYQIFNLRILNERSLSDRLYNGSARMQAVLGFQVSINPPEGAEDCVAVVEIGLALEASKELVSIVAMIPQEKTYNAAFLSSKANSIDGSVVTKVLTLGGKASRQSDHYYLHRDCDTISFERDLQKEAGAFGLRWPRQTSPPAVVGWEFRPVLGRRVVSPGTRQMLAVIALPCGDALPVQLIVHSRSYWRSYDRKYQVSNVPWQWWPLPARLGGIPPWSRNALAIDAPANVELTLGPKIHTISWVNAGGGTAVVLIGGENLFSGTQVTIGGQIHRGPETNLTIKSDHALEVRTTVGALAEGDAVLSGRFGPSIPLVISKDKLPAAGIYVDGATFWLQPDGKFVQLRVTIRSPDAAGKKHVLLDDLRHLPEPILYLNGQALAGPYDYDDCYSSQAGPAPAHGTPDSRVKDAFRVQTWAPASFFHGTGPVLAFKVPFCGTDWVAQTVLQTADVPVITLLSSNPNDSTLLISGQTSFEGEWTAVLDQEYKLQTQDKSGTGKLQQIDRLHLCLEVPTAALAEYSKLILRCGPVAGYVLDLPPRGAAPLAAHLDLSSPPFIVTGANGLCEWKGSNLNQVTGAKIDAVDSPFLVYDAGTRISVFIAAATAIAGKHDVEFVVGTGAPLKAAFFVVDRASTLGNNSNSNLPGEPRKTRS